MSNTRQAAKPKTEENGQADDKRAQQAAQQAEANGRSTTFEFDGFEYEILDGQPSWIALDYLARWQTDDDNMALVPAVKEIIGEDQFRLAATRHRGDQMVDFFAAMNKVAGGNA